MFKRSQCQFVYERSNLCMFSFILITHGYRKLDLSEQLDLVEFLKHSSILKRPEPEPKNIALVDHYHVNDVGGQLRVFCKVVDLVSLLLSPLSAGSHSDESQDHARRCDHLECRTAL